ncbi:MAG: FtsX-like permease family protein [Gemmatimonadales bacterium]
MAAREIRAAPRRLLLLTASIAIGVAALVAIGSFTDNLRDSVRSQARALLGADFALSSRRALPKAAETVLDTLTAQGGTVARLTSFSGMAYVPRTSGTRLVQVAAVQGGYPFYGEIRTDPAAAWRELGQGHRVVVDPSLLTALSARIGDTLALGEARFVISGAIVSAPGNVGVRTAFGPRIYIAARDLPETRLLGFGARAEYEAFVRLASGISAQALAEHYRPALLSERVRVRTVAEDQANLNDALGRLTGYLGLVGLIALLLGGIGVASGVVVFIRQRLDTIAVLRCLGASAGRVLAIYAAEAAAMGFAGSALVAAVGVLAQRLLPGLLAGLLPVEVQPVVSPGAVALGLGMGLWVALIFALIPLLAVRRVPPLAALRRDVEPEGRRWLDPLRLTAAAALAISVVVLAELQVGSWRKGAAFSAGVAVALLVLWGAAWLLIRAVRRWLPAGWPYVWRQGLANLHRPANQTATVVLAIGFGAFLLGTLFLVQYNLLRTLRITGGPARPNLVLFDIQPDQVPIVNRVLADGGYRAVGPVPIVPMRVQSIKGRPAMAAPADTLDPPGEGGLREGGPGRRDNWAVRREYRSTYRDTLVASERMIEGRWWTRAAGPTQVSVEREVAGELGVGVGDEIVWDIQGVPLTTRVASVREVDWARFEPNFFVVFAPGALEGAPQTYVTLTRVETAAARGVLQRRIAERLPNVTSVDLSTVQETLERLIDRVVLAIRFMALFTLGTGTLVLVGALATSRFQRIREGALLRTLGATRAQLFRIVLSEYLSLGLLAAAVALALAGVAAWALARFVFDGTFTLPVGAFAALGAAVVLLTVVVGLANSREVLRRPPLEVLRAE